MSNLGSGEIIIIGVVLLLLFGNKKLKEFARGLGESGAEFDKIKKDFKKVAENLDLAETEKEDQ